MSPRLNSEAQAENDSIVLAQANVDELLQMVTEQITLHQFNSNDQDLLRRMVTEGLGDQRGLVRLRCAELLGEIGEPATPMLVEALSQHADPVVRRAAAKTLTLIADPTAVPTLIQSFLHDEDTVVRGSSAGALARTGEVAVPALLDILASPDSTETTKGHAAWALAFIGAEATEYLCPALKSDSLDVRCAVVGAIAKVLQEQYNENLYTLLISALTDPESLIRAEAASGLGQLTNASAVPHLILALRDSDVDVRKSAASALGKVGDASALEPLRATLADQQEVVRVLAKVAIAQLERRLAADDC
jgi:bilin biosynthesis protein